MQLKITGKQGDTRNCLDGLFKHVKYFFLFLNKNIMFVLVTVQGLFSEVSAMSQ